MASKYKVTIKSACKAYRSPSTSSSVSANIRKNSKYTQCTKVTQKKKSGKKTVSTVWYKLGSSLYVQSKYCKATLTSGKKTDNKSSKNSKTNKKKKKEKLKSPKELERSC